MITKVFDVALKIGREDIVTAPAIVVQNDYDVYGLSIKIFDGNAEIDYSQVTSATITFALANKAVVQSVPERLTLSESGISYEMGTSEIAYPGSVIASVQLFGADGERLTTARFKFTVQSDLITPGAIQSDSNFPLLQQLLADVEQLKQDIVNLQVSDNSLMDAKLSNAAGQIKARVATHLADNTAHGVSHKNLLHNWDFRSSVNQRGLTSTLTSFTNAYTLDRWKMINIGSIAIKDGYITVTGTGSYAPNLRQIIETARTHFAGKVVTFSAYVKGSCRIGISGSYGENYVNLTTWTLVKRTLTLTSEGSLYVDISTLDVNGTFDVLCTKLELGSQSTLANDPPADYGEQLALCQRYYLPIEASNFFAGSVISSGTNTQFLIPTPVTMRIAPSLIENGSGDLWHVRTASASTIVSTNATILALKSNGVLLSLTHSALTALHPAAVFRIASGCALSAEL